MSNLFKALVLSTAVFLVPSQASQSATPSRSLCNPSAFQHSGNHRSNLHLNDIRNRRRDSQQPYDSLDKLYQLAPQAQQELALILERSTGHSHCESVIADVKSPARAETKIATELNHQATELTDLVRASIIADSPEQLVQAYEQLEQQAELVAVKNRFAEPGPSGYRDLKVLVTLPQSGLIAEVQLHLRSIYELKNGPDHQRYQQIQKIERMAQGEGRPLNQHESATIAQLREQSQQDYHFAWLPYHDPLLAA